MSQRTHNHFVEETMQTIKALRRVKFKGRMYDPQCQALTVLCECREKVNTKSIPLDVLPGGSDFPWRIVGPSEEEHVSTEEHRRDAVQEEQQVPGPGFTLHASTPESIIRAVGDIMQRTSKHTSDSNSYRRLRTFSGAVPTPPGEEQLDNWIERARLMIEECD